MTKPDDLVETNVQTEYYDGGIVNRMSGLTKREYFSALALEGMITHANSFKSPETIAKSAVKLADALIRALNEETL